MTGDASFEWDEAKDRLNRVKHGVPFALAQRAFFDPRRVIAEGLSHSGTEQRYFCFGEVAGGIMTVRFTWRDRRIRIIGAPAIGEKERRSMSNRTVKYTAGEIGRVRVVEDFLPSPDALAPREQNVKVTLALSRRSVDFFKRAAQAAPRALSTHDPRAGGCLCGEAGREVTRRAVQ